MTDMVTLKKYSNRRLYNTETSKYVTLEAVGDMVKAGRQVKIVDAKTKADVTAFVLTQIVLEEARNKNILLPVPVLHQIIRYGDNALEDFFDKYLQRAIKNYLDYKRAFDNQMKQWLDMGMDMSRTAPGTGQLANMMTFFSNPMAGGTATQADGNPEDTDDSENT